MHENDSQSEEPILKVSDRRHFTESGERRAGVEAAASSFEETPPAPPSPPPSGKEHATPAKPAASAPATPAAEPEPAPRHERLAAREITFTSLIQDLYATCLMQMGAELQPGQPGQLDLEGARETIDLLAMLQEKTQGNLPASEANILERVLYELRLAYVEVQRAATSRVQPARVAPPPPRRR